MEVNTTYTEDINKTKILIDKLQAMTYLLDTLVRANQSEAIQTVTTKILDVVNKL